MSTRTGKTSDRVSSFLFRKNEKKDVAFSDSM